MKAEQQINKFFAKQKQFFDHQAPGIISKTAVEYYKESFRKKAFDGKPWPAMSKGYKPKRGSLMVRSSKLLNSIRDTMTTAERVVISAGNSKVPYAKIHNEGGVINRASRSELFIRNRNKANNRFRKGTKSGRGSTFKSFTARMPQRQFMGYSFELNERIIKRIKAAYKSA
tara:strand:- start:1019 stop:1531 length:513 start_codon:yes stop_codon:yes gene_type:complete